jgi:hypothetical protein
VTSLFLATFGGSLGNMTLPLGSPAVTSTIMAGPPLNPDDLRKYSAAALRVIYSRGMVRFRDISRLAEIPPEHSPRVLYSLADRKLVTIQSGSLASGTGLASLDAYVAPLPSGRAAAEQVMGESSA